MEDYEAQALLKQREEITFYSTQFRLAAQTILRDITIIALLGTLVYLAMEEQHHKRFSDTI